VENSDINFNGGFAMSKKPIKEDICWVGALDPDRKLFDALMPLPCGTTYNAYLVRGSEKTALIDTVEPEKMADLFRNLEDVEKIDYIVCNHTEQDHSGSIPEVLGKYPGAKVICIQKTKEMLQDLMAIEDRCFEVVADGEEVSLGNKTLRFMHLPWVHWPETTVTYIPEDKILFSCDLFGSHYSFGDQLFAGENPVVYKEAKEYYAEIMMLYARTTGKHLDRIRPLALDYICTSHGPVYDQPQMILDLYEDWMRGEPKNLALIAFVSTHGSTRIMAEHLAAAVEKQGVKVKLFDLVGLPLNDISSALVDAATIVLGSSVIMAALHPYAVNAAFLIDRLRPKAKFAAVFGSYGWSPGPLQKAAALLPSLKVEVLGAVLAKGHPKGAAFAELDALAGTIAAKHREAGLL
jgi:flavorubredoxin